MKLLPMRGGAPAASPARARVGIEIRSGRVGVWVQVRVGVWVGVRVGVRVRIGVGVRVQVRVGVGVRVRVRVRGGGGKHCKLQTALTLAHWWQATGLAALLYCYVLSAVRHVRGSGYALCCNATRFGAWVMLLYPPCGRDIYMLASIDGWPGRMR